MPFITDRLTEQIQRRTESYTYTDTAYYIAAPSIASLDEYGHPTPSTTETEFFCAFTDKPNVETWKEMDIEEVNAEIRFSAFEPDKGGKIRLASHFGVETDQTFEIVGIQNRGAFGWVCGLKAVSV